MQIQKKNVEQTYYSYHYNNKHNDCESSQLVLVTGPTGNNQIKTCLRC